MSDLIRFLKSHQVGTVVRLNNRTYDRSPMVAAGITHVELYFPDGTTPPDGILMRFLELCESTPGAIAVHCKAGLGRTGTLIASYLMKHYKFTASEVISLLRILRPGCVVGPQQNYLQSMQSKLHKLHPSATLPPYISLLKAPTWPNLTRWSTDSTPRSKPTSPPTPTTATNRAAADELRRLERATVGPTTSDNTRSALVEAFGDPASERVNHPSASAARIHQMAIPVQPRKTAQTAREVEREKEQEIRMQVQAAKELAKKTVPPADRRATNSSDGPTAVRAYTNNYTASLPHYVQTSPSSSRGSSSRPASRDGRPNTSGSSTQPRTEKEIGLGYQQGQGQGQQGQQGQGQQRRDLLVVGKRQPVEGGKERDTASGRQR
ncbi:Dual specificity protein phosphatase cdc14a [Thoreauomyces humboldtii]|nr:Dual specificity protein phosphatase cdc14a [Thoreauomyces humboldtii]